MSRPKMMESKSVSTLKRNRSSSGQKLLSKRMQSLALSKMRFSIVSSVALFFLVCSLAAPAATVTWTNTAGGAWSLPANWSPNQLPGAADDAIIDIDGSYTVALDQDATLGSLALGGVSGRANFDEHLLRADLE
jgi:hypothetical protein